MDDAGGAWKRNQIDIRLTYLMVINGGFDFEAMLNYLGT